MSLLGKVAVRWARKIGHEVRILASDYANPDISGKRIPMWTASCAAERNAAHRPPTEKNALVIPPDDPAALPSALRRLESNPTLRSQLSSAGLECRTVHGFGLRTANRRRARDSSRAGTSPRPENPGYASLYV